MNRQSLSTSLLLLTLSFAACGQDPYQAEFDFERRAVPLARESREGDYSLIMTKELRRKLQEEKDKLIFIDAMPADSFTKGHIEGARNFSFPKEAMNSWDETVMDGKRQEDYAAFLGADKSRQVVVYCGFVKCLRSHNAALWARRIGFKTVMRYPGGLYAWQGAKLPLQTK